MHETAQTEEAARAISPSRCNRYAWTPEVHELYGDPEAILAKMDTLDMDLSSRRIFALLVESEGAADVRLFERTGTDEYTISTWTGEALDGLGGRIADTILANRGVHCVGEQTRAVLAPLGLTEHAGVPAPANPRAAFAHTVRGHGTGTFTRATCALLC